MAFCIAYVTGIVFAKTEFGAFYQSTKQMGARDWPQFIDLMVAFVSGIAAAYASGRPGLLAALPGVAIAASLIPPVATSGLALSIGQYHLGLGALLLFVINILAIILGASISVWAIGVRHVGKVHRLTRFLGTVLKIVTIILALQLAFAPPLNEAPTRLVQEIESTLTDDFRLRDVRLSREARKLSVQVDVGGAQLPDSSLKQRLGNIARKHLGEQTELRLTFRYEAVSK
jgi:uncharacterized membrane protein